MNTIDLEFDDAKVILEADLIASAWVHITNQDDTSLLIRVLHLEVTCSTPYYPTTQAAHPSLNRQS